LLGVAVVRSWLKVAADTTVEAKHGLDRWWAIGRERLRLWWLRRRGQTRPAYMSGTARGTSSVSATLTVHRRRVDRDTISDREWLTFLDDRLESVFELMDLAEQNRDHERDDFNRRLAAQQRKLRAEIQRETRQGWQLIVAGLIWSGAGTVVGIFG
jgi:hypothetical protein